jgi:hypothetical protein
MSEEGSYQRSLRERDERQKILEPIVQFAMKRVLNSISSKSPKVVEHLFYGALGIDPKHLSAWYIFSKDSELEEAKRDGLTTDISTLTRTELQNGGYPSEALPKIYVSFTSQEDIQNKTGGNYYLYFK